MISIEKEGQGRAIIHVHDAPSCPFALWKKGEHQPYCTIHEEHCPVNYEDDYSSCPLCNNGRIVVDGGMI